MGHFLVLNKNGISTVDPWHGDATKMNELGSVFFTALVKKRIYTDGHK